MGYFRVLVEGSGFELLSTSEQIPVRGFLVSRIVRARSAAEAGHLGLAHVGNEWGTGKYSSHGVSPVVSVAEVQPIGFLSALFSRQPGYVFHPG
jgi:hypothetical protein